MPVNPTPVAYAIGEEQKHWSAPVFQYTASDSH